MMKYEYEVNGKVVSEVEAKMNGNYVLVEYVMGKDKWVYNGHYEYKKGEK